MLDVNKYLGYNFKMVPIPLSKMLSSKDISIKSKGCSFDYVTDLKNISCDAIKVFKRNVTRSQHEGKGSSRTK